MNGNNACDNSCYRVCKLWVFWAVCCAELLTCSAELPPQSSHSDRYSGSLVLSPTAKLKILGKTVEQHELQDYSLCTILFLTKMLDTNQEKSRKFFFLFWPCSMCAWLVLSKILVVYSGTLFELLSQFCKLHFTHAASSCSAHPWNWESKFMQNMISNNWTTEPGIEYFTLYTLH